MRFEPHPYQQYAIDRIVAEPALGLFQDMGLGKTVEVLTAVHELKFNRWAVTKPLVIAPKKVAEASSTARTGRGARPGGWCRCRTFRTIPCRAWPRRGSWYADGISTAFGCSTAA